MKYEVFTNPFKCKTILFKSNVLTLFLFLIILPGFSQSFGDASNARSNPIVKQEKLNDVELITDLSAHLWESMILPNKDRIAIDEHRKMSYALGYYVYPQGGYNTVIDYVYVVISAKSKGIVLTAESSSEKLSDEQKRIIQSAGVGADIGINIRFRHNDLYKSNLAEGDVITGWTTVTIVPETEAEFPGGYAAAANYVSKNVIKKMSVKEPQVTVSFTVNEEGKVIGPRMVGMSKDLKAEQLLKDAVLKMPTWKSAKNAKGIKVKQEFSFQYGGGGC